MTRKMSSFASDSMENKASTEASVATTKPREKSSAFLELQVCGFLRIVAASV
jgi:hypothetical protein